MTKYKYTAVNKENKQLQGIINAVDETAARTELNNIGLSVIDISESNDAETTASEKKNIYHFSARDKTGKKIVGTIKSADEMQSYIRLRDEYGFEVLGMELEMGGMKTKIDVETLKQNATAQAVQTPNASDDASMQQTTKTATEERVEKILAEVENTLQTTGEKLNQVGRKKIDEQINKLKLIKSSTNEEYVQESCEILLNLIKDPENYQKETQNVEETSRRTIETQKLINQLKKKESAQDGISKKIIDKIRSLSMPGDGKPSFFKKMLQETSQSILKWFEKDPRIIELENTIKEINSEIWSYWVLWFKSAKSAKSEIKQSIDKLNTKKNELKAEIAHIKQEINVQQSIKNTTENTHPATDWLLAINTFTGWLLIFYSIYYVVGFILATKNLGFNQNLIWNFNIYTIPLLKTIIILSFIVHASTAIKISFFRYNKISTIVIPILTLAISILALANL